MQENDAELCVSLNITKQQPFYASNNIADQLEVRAFGHRFNLRLSSKL